MKILQLFCFPLYGSGSGSYVRNFSDALREAGHEVGIVCPDERKLPGIKIYPLKLPFWSFFTGHPEHPEGKIYSQLSGSELNEIQSAFMAGIIKAVENFKPDVIHVHHASNLSWVANYIKAVYQISFLVTSHNTDVINAILDRRYIPLTRDALVRADAIIAVSKNTRENLLKVFTTTKTKLANKVKVIPCGINTRDYLFKGDVGPVIGKYKLNGKKVALFSGKITPIKGLDLFVRAAKYFPQAAFIIVGAGDYLKKLQQIIEAEKITNVIFTGYLGSEQKNLIKQLYRRADVVCVPSTLSEGIPLSVLEAMASGTLPIASNIGGIPTVVRNMKNGLLIKPRSLSSLVEALKIAFGNEKLVAKLTQQARADAVQKYDWQVIVKKITRFYKTAYSRSLKLKSTKKPPHISEKEYDEDKKFVEQFGRAK